MCSLVLCNPQCGNQSTQHSAEWYQCRLLLLVCDHWKELFTLLFATLWFAQYTMYIIDIHIIYTLRTLLLPSITWWQAKYEIPECFGKSSVSSWNWTRLYRAYRRVWSAISPSQSLLTERLVGIGLFTENPALSVIFALEAIWAVYKSPVKEHFWQSWTYSVLCRKPSCPLTGFPQKWRKR